MGEIEQRKEDGKNQIGDERAREVRQRKRGRQHQKGHEKGEEYEKQQKKKDRKIDERKNARNKIALTDFGMDSARKRKEGKTKENLDGRYKKWNEGERLGRTGLGGKRRMEEEKEFKHFGYRKMSGEERMMLKETKELSGSLSEKKLATERRIGRNGEREKSSGQKMISDDRRH
ncbi:hypothetical protein ANN_20921 [Periplaneta americana]|uniref:Uncharacterized protein n=1 Tax=Periplaneta americana TaxID=6978 RepID=A0ABQ8SF29_PERAM|nr:hypothetical protein ANN_20921 [Periplaneta americana]